jgi:uncharacterized alpha-E superfamily protein
MERADGLLRLVRTSYILSFDKTQTGGINWQPALEIFTNLSPEEITLLKNNHAEALHFLLTDNRNHNSLKAILTKARENARGVQDQITKEVWEQVNLIYRYMQNPSLQEKLKGNDAIEAIDQLIGLSDQYCGITDSTMPRGQGWNYMNIGKYSERCILTVDYMQRFYEIVDYNIYGHQDILYWRSLLLALSGYELHLKNYSNQQHNANVAKQLLFGKYFPRSVYYSLDRAGKYLHDITTANPITGSGAITRCFGRMNSLVTYADLEQVNEQGLQDFLQEIRQLMYQFTQRFTQLYFSYS